MVLAALRKYIAGRRQAIADKFPKQLGRAEYHRNCGRLEELESLSSFLQDAIRRANAAEAAGEPDVDLET